MEWRSVVGYEGLYEVSDEGQIRSFWLSGRYAARGKSRSVELSPTPVRLIRPSPDGAYLNVNLRDRNRVVRAYKVHRLVAAAFQEKPDGCDVVNHLDNDPRNNRNSNLEWTTPAGNSRHAAKQGRCGYRAGRSRPKVLTDDQIFEIRMCLFEGLSRKAAARKLDVPVHRVQYVATSPDAYGHVPKIESETLATALALNDPWMIEAEAL